MHVSLNENIDLPKARLDTLSVAQTGWQFLFRAMEQLKVLVQERG